MIYSPSCHTKTCMTLILDGKTKGEIPENVLGPLFHAITMNGDWKDSQTHTILWISMVNSSEVNTRRSCFIKNTTKRYKRKIFSSHISIHNLGRNVLHGSTLAQAAVYYICLNYETNIIQIYSWATFRTFPTDYSIYKYGENSIQQESIWAIFWSQQQGLWWKYSHKLWWDAVMHVEGYCTIHYVQQNETMEKSKILLECSNLCKHSVSLHSFLEWNLQHGSVRKGEPHEKKVKKCPGHVSSLL